MKLKVVLFLILFTSFENMAAEVVSSGSMEFSDDSSNSKAEDYFLYTKANYQHKGNEFDKALQTFQKLFERKPSIYAYVGYANLLFDANQYQKIIDLPDSVKDKFKDETDFQLTLAQAYLFADKDKKASELFENLSLENPNNEYVAYYTAVSYLKNNQIDKALAFINRSLNKKSLSSKHFLFYFLKSKLFMQQGQPHKALEFASKSVELFPRFDKGWLFKSLLSEQLGKVNDAIKGYQRFLDLTGRDTTIERQLVNLLFMQKRFSDAADVLKKIPGDSPDYYFDLALVEWKSGNNQKALDYINKTLQKVAGFRKAKVLKIELLLSLKQQKKAVDFAASWIDAEPNDVSVIHTFMLLARANAPINLMIEKLQTLAKKHYKSIVILSALSDLYTEKNDYKNAESNYKKLLALTKDESLKSKILFQLGYIYFVTNQKNKVEKTLIDATKMESVYPSAYNLLAYYYAQENEKLAEAEKLVNKALKINPDRFDYIDTKGYILLKQNKKQQAAKFFEQALKIAPKDKIIMKHLELARGK